LSPQNELQIERTKLPLGTLLGEFKDEVDGATVLSFHGLSPKCYEMKVLTHAGDKFEFITKIRGFQLRSEVSLQSMAPGCFSTFTENFKHGVFQTANIPQFRFQISGVRKLRAEIITKALNNDTYNKRAVVKHENSDIVVNFTLPYGFSKNMLAFYRDLDKALFDKQYQH
jgi:hypothetical protein